MSGTGLTRYTNTYGDVDDAIIDAPDLIAEYHRVAEFLNTWAENLDQLSPRIRNKQFVFVEANTIEIDPADGFLQRFIVDGDVGQMNFNFVRREAGEPYRVIAILRFQSKGTRFTVSGPAGDSGQFGPNITEDYDPEARNSNPLYMPSQREADGHYAAVAMASYGSTNGAYIQVFAHNDIGDDDNVLISDTLTGKPI